MENENDSHTKFCQKCGKKILADATFCPYCGAAQGTLNNQATATASTTTEQAQPQGQAPVQPQAQKRSVGAFVTWGWITTVIGLFIPVVAIAGIVLGSLTVTRKHTGAGVTLIVFACIALYLGLTGFGQGFFSAL
ncbi:zinc-ribbon domain-containing protein [Levilactobacillus tujiorum]|uniref:Zinc-ribbon domain-containing protein n=1 Tax=Levilactobacillus tujiorum TaxID=2912243 RepID=A0ABX1L4G0_9LACO|nr:zinc-ribbon domain-containing protein [Levilactobacillus tujiorum]MCH5464245.1 zinc-ribbon domain-containing protein [Levilactobacillus tujiorum]NLR11321.1 zinc-ribbon domain-containing protein [Lactobacillus sp. HBUAS51387]NLR29226.1 zinc-ribbon domain-containing protein [Levilactobacillus tujiorum]